MRRAWWVFAVPLAVVAFWPRLALTRLYDPDEFEHLHAAWCIVHGQVPYLDFFEHHGPLTYYLLAPFARRMGDTPNLLTVHRALSGFWVAVAAVGVWALLQHRPVWCRGAAMLWLFTFPWFLEKAIEGRPDVPAMALMTWAAWMVQRGVRPRGTGWILAAGATVGVASLFTQKVLFLAGGLAIGGLIARKRHGRGVWKAILAATVGVTMPWGVAVLWFLEEGALGAFVNRVIVTPATWPAHVIKTDETVLYRICNGLASAPGHLAVLLVAVCAVAGALRQAGVWRRGDGVLWCGLIAHLSGAGAAPGYLQYYLLAAPVAAALVGGRLPVAVRRRPAILVCVVTGFFLLGAWLRGEEFRATVAHWAAFVSPGVGATTRLRPESTVDLVVAVVVVVSAIAALLSLARGRGGRSAWVGVLLAAALAPGVERLVFVHLYWGSGARQRQDLAEFGERFPGPVLDGFSGYGCLRPHVGYWWWINHHSIPLMRRERALEGVLGAARDRTPGVVIFDEDLRQLPGLEAQLWRGYDPQPFGGAILFVRREATPP